MQPDNYSQPSSNAEQSPTTGLKSTTKLYETSPKAITARALKDTIYSFNPSCSPSAASVSLRTDSIAPVSPPPPSFRQAQTPLPARRLNRGRGNARKLGQNDGEDSESDSDKNQKPVRSESSDNAKSRPRTIEEPPGSSLADSEMRAKEETERLGLRRILRLIGQYWTKIYKRRKSNADEGHEKEDRSSQAQP